MRTRFLSFPSLIRSSPLKKQSVSHLLRRLQDKLSDVRACAVRALYALQSDVASPTAAASLLALLTNDPCPYDAADWIL